MQEYQEKFLSFDLSNNYKPFPIVKARNSIGAHVGYDLRFILLEIKSIQPPTDLILNYQFTLKSEGPIKYTTIHFMKYRKLFILEGGFYSIYLNEVPELNEPGVPFLVSFENERDPECSVKLFYHIKFHELVN